MTVIFTMNDIHNMNKDTLFVGCYNDMESCKEAILKNVNEYIKVNEFSESEISNDESYYTIFDTEEKKRFFVCDFVTKTSVEVTELQ